MPVCHMECWMLGCFSTEIMTCTSQTCSHTLLPCSSSPFTLPLASSEHMLSQNSMIMGKSGEGCALPQPSLDASV